MQNKRTSSKAEDKCPLGDILSSLGPLKVDLLQPNIAEARLSAPSESFWTVVQRVVHSHRGRDIKGQKNKITAEKFKKPPEAENKLQRGAGIRSELSFWRTGTTHTTYDGHMRY